MNEQFKCEETGRQQINTSKGYGFRTQLSCNTSKVGLTMERIGIVVLNFQFAFCFEIFETFSENEVNKNKSNIIAMIGLNLRVPH